MILSALQFLIAILFSIVAAYVAGLSEGDIPIIAFLIPALWLLPKSGFSSVVMLLAMGIFGLTLPLHRWRCLSVSGCLFRC
ncbi:integral membrane protein [Vibrio cholerae]|nr:integral membrane protein [Vibrio cholerae]